MAITEIIREGKTYRQEWTVKDEHKPDLIRRIKEITNHFNLKPTTTNPDCIHQMKLLEAAFCLKQLPHREGDEFDEWVRITLYDDGDETLTAILPMKYFNLDETPL